MTKTHAGTDNGTAQWIELEEHEGVDAGAESGPVAEPPPPATQPPSPATQPQAQSASADPFGALAEAESELSGAARAAAKADDDLAMFELSMQELGRVALAQQRALLDGVKAAQARLDEFRRSRDRLSAEQNAFLSELAAAKQLAIVRYGEAKALVARAQAALSGVD
jgi:hypothetical protein